MAQTTPAETTWHKLLTYAAGAFERNPATALRAVTGVSVSVSWHGKDRIDLKRWKLIRLKVLDSCDGWRCVQCGHQGRLECDHKIPLDAGGDPYSLDNIAPLCRPCHFQKTRRERDAKLLHPEIQAWRKLIASRIRDTM